MASVVIMMLAGTEARAEWEQIDASEPFTDRHGIVRTPSCSGGPVTVPTEDGQRLEAAATDFSFFIRRGDPRRLMIIWDGGGACWDETTCIDSVLADDPLYVASITEDPSGLAEIGGLADIGNPDNPVRDFTQVLIPYCTADLHFGARDTSYRLPDEGAWTIRHRGQDNSVAVLEYLANHYASDIGEPPWDILLVGASAGGYGVLYHYPAVAELFSLASNVNLLVDSANGIVTQDLFDKALAPEGAWGAREHLAPELEAAFASGADRFVAELFRDLGRNHPETAFGQYSRALDAVQVLFYNISRHPDMPVLWTDPAQLLMAGLEWSAQSRSSMRFTAWTTRNYRFYFARGVEHTIIADQRFYEENSACGVHLSAWLRDMLDHPLGFGSNWRNLSCGFDCLPADLGGYFW